MTTETEFGIVGLGRIGGNLALQALEKGLRVVGYVARSSSRRDRQPTSAPPQLEPAPAVQPKQC